jgi:epoxyqueuosine reductase
MHNIVEKIKSQALQMGFSAAGICNASPLEDEGKLLEMWLGKNYHGGMAWLERTRKERANPDSYFRRVKSILVVAHNYYREDEPLNMPPEKGNISIYARGRDYHKVIRKKLKELLQYVQTLIPDTEGRICVDSFPIMEKPLAVRAGIGWIGKHTNLILKGSGSYFFLGEILLTTKLPKDNIFSEDFCGTCNRCQVACPTNALKEAYVLDASRCISYLTIEHHGVISEELQSEMGNWVFGCDICQDVCPWNRFSENTSEDAYKNIISSEWYDLNRMKEMSNEQFEELFAGTAVKRAGYQNFMRNVEIALENSRRE